MIRKILVTVISITYMVLGVWNFYNALFPVFSSEEGIWLLHPLRIAGGALAFYAGLAMFRLNDFGRKFIVILLFFRVGINVWTMWQVFSYLENSAAWGIRNDLGEIVYRINSPYAYHGFLFAWIVIASLMIIFLSQRETRELFVPEAIRDAEPDIIFEE